MTNYLDLIALCVLGGVATAGGIYVATRPRTPSKRELRETAHFERLDRLEGLLRQSLTRASEFDRDGTNIDCLRPPEGYSSWLDYALDCLDTRSLEQEEAMNDNPDELHWPAGTTREQWREAAKAELGELRAKAAWTEQLYEHLALISPETFRCDSIALLDGVACLGDLPDTAVRRGQVGTVVEVLEPGHFLVEFDDKATGRSIAILPVAAGQLLKLHEQ